MSDPPVAAGSAHRTLSRAAQVAGAVVLALVVVVLAGWVFDVELMRRGLGPSNATTKVNAALGLGALAAFLLRPESRLAPLLSASALVIGAVTSVQSLFGVSLGVDELLVQDTDPDSVVPGRMAVATAVSLAFLGAAQLLLRAGRARTAQALLVVPGALAVLALLGWGFGVEELYGIGPYSTMAEQTAAMVGTLALATGGLVPGGLVSWVVLDRGLGAGLSRRMLPVVVLVIPVIGYAALQGEDLEVWGERFGHALMAAAIGTVFIVATLVAARQLDGVDAQRAAAMAELAKLNETLREGRDAEWRRAEALSRDLEQQRERFRRAIGKVDDLVWTVEVTPEGPAPVRLVFASPNATGVFGGQPQPGDGGVEPFLRLVHPDDSVTSQQFLKQIVAGEQAEAELRVRGFDGVQRWLWIRGAPRREGDRLFCDGIATNVTERQELAQQREEMLRLEQERVRSLRELNRLRDEFLATAGHELRSPLTSVLGFAELLLEDDALGARQRDYAQVIVERTRQLAELVGDMFDLTRLESGMAQLELRPTDLAVLVADAVAAHRPAAAEAHVEITAQLEPVVGEVDTMRFRQVLDNLLTNAVRYSRDRGTVHVECRPDGATAVLTVADDGIGIPADELDKVFDRLYRASNATQQGIVGTGLGLALTKAIVEAHHGDVSVRSEAGRGTVFEVRLPLTGG